MDETTSVAECLEMASWWRKAASAVVVHPCVPAAAAERSTCVSAARGWLARARACVSPLAVLAIRERGLRD